MEKYSFITIYTLALLLKLTSGQIVVPCSMDTSPYKGPPIPKIPDSFAADIVKTYVNQKQGMVYDTGVDHLYFDAQRKVAVQVGGGSYGSEGKKIILDGNRQEAMTIQGKNCNVTSFSDFSMDRDLVYGPTDFTTGNDFFRFGAKYHPKFIGNIPFQNINTSAWVECLPSLGENKTANVSVMYLFTNDSTNSMKFYGYQAQSTKDKFTINRVYNLKLGSPFPEQFIIPTDVFCNMSKTSYNMPKMPDEFEMNMEVLIPQNKTVGNVRDYIDTKEKYFRSDRHHKDEKTGKYVPVHEIHDFNTGISYMINSKTFDCELSPLTNKSYDAIETDDHHHIRMRTTEEFFALDHRFYIHEGYTTVRGIPVDIFSAKVPSRRNPAVKNIMKWYFSRPGWYLIGIEGPLNTTRVPVMLNLIGNRTSMTANLFNFDPTEPTNHILWPLRQCYKNNRHYMYFRLSGQFDKFGLTNQRVLTNAIRDALSKAGKVSKLRVSSVLIFKSGYGGVVAVRVYVLGLPSIKGTVNVLHPIHQTPLKDAVDGIRKTIKTGKFVVKFPHKSQGKTETVVLNGIKDSYFDYSAGPDPYEPDSEHGEGKKAGLAGGAVVGIVFAVVIITVVITITALYVVLKRRGVQLFNYSRYSNEPTA